MLNGSADLSQYGEVVEQNGAAAKLRVPKSATANVTSRLLADLAIADLTVEDPPIDEVIEQVFATQLDTDAAYGKEE
jgi:ABC-2 type transport system ATP-binding protein